MNHTEALRMNAAEKYVLGELPANLRDAYEAHYFECAECALEVRTAAAFVDTAREVFRGEARNVILAPVTPPQAQRLRGGSASTAREKSGWFGLAWLKPSFAAPVFAAALLLLVAYQNVVQIPRLKLASAQFATDVYGPSLRLVDTRGASGASLTIRPREGFLLDFDFTPSVNAASYTAELRDPSGRALLQAKIAASEANQSLHLPVPPGLVRNAGRYALVFTAAAPSSQTGESQPSTSGQTSAAAEVQRFAFTVAFGQ
jgi:hypothetical protein